MNRNKKFVITINRELGSGGRTIGRKLAERLGVDFFDKALIEALEKKYNLSAEKIEEMKGKKKSWWEDFGLVMGIGGSEIRDYHSKMSEASDRLTTEKMFKTETEILEGIAATESCVITGRSGFYVFRNHPNHLCILIQASMPYRLERVMRKQNVSENEARKLIDKVDQMRENYVKRYTETSRYDTRNYDLVIKVDGKTEDEIVDYILQFIN